MKDIPEYEGLYATTKDGKVWSYPKKKGYHDGIFLKPASDKDGYLRVRLFKERGSKSILVHRIVAQTHIPNPHNLPQVNHKNFIKTDNRVENLEWCTNQENINHSVLNNLNRGTKGENHHSAKLTEENVLYIRLNRSQGVSVKTLSKQFGVNDSTIRRITNRIKWKHVQ